MKKIYSSLALLLFAGISLCAQTTFNYTGAVQTYTVPACATSINVTVLGAKGGNGTTIPGGSGGSVQATIPVTPGEVLNIYVGQQGTDNVISGPATFNGGGSVFSYTSDGTAGTGGGASDIRRSPYTTTDRLVVAGGGGGGGYQNCAGGNGGGLTGQDGVPFPSWPNAGGKGGTQSTGGNAGIACCSCPTYTSSGTLLQGGNGSGDGAGGGGGGGGYYGGGGSCFSGGGGGSSYADPSATGVIHTQGANNAAGQVVITPVQGVPASPTSITGATIFCEGSTTNFSTGTVAGATSYTWSVPVGSTINSGQGTTAINVTLGTSSGAISVTADNTCGSSAATTFSITVNPAPPVMASANNAIICDGSSSILTGSGASTYTWMPGTLSGTTVTVIPATTTTYTVTGMDVNGCTNTNSVIVTVNLLPTITASTTAGMICAGDAVTLSGGGAVSYTWTGSVTDNVAFNPAATNSYTVTGVDANGCSNTASVTVTVNPLPVISVAFAMDTVCLTGGMVTLSGESPAGGTWSGPGVTGNMFDPQTAGIGWAPVTYSFTDANGCSNSLTDSVNVDVCAGVTTYPSIGNVNIYPNPNSGTFSIALNAAVSDLVIVITDMQGRVVYSSIENNAQAGYSKQVSLEKESSGLYFVSITANGEQRVEKISVQK
ncbi:MAG: glycine-rich protein [Bacteroidia bacterium]